MKRAAIGIRAHSGWGAIVVVSGAAADVEIIDRKRIAITAPAIAGAKQPYHFAQTQSLPQAEAYLAECAAVSEVLAAEALGFVVEQLRRYDYAAVGCAILQASGRPLPSLPRILASHPLIHTAEGAFFREAFRRASERLGIEVTAIRERDLDGRAASVFGSRALELQRKIAGLGRSVGPPWTTDQKSAALAALLVLARPQSGTVRG
jgi:hypothetical protein